MEKERSLLSSMSSVNKRACSIYNCSWSSISAAEQITARERSVSYLFSGKNYPCSESSTVSLFFQEFYALCRRKIACKT